MRRSLFFGFLAAVALVGIAFGQLPTLPPTVAPQPTKTKIPTRTRTRTPANTALPTSTKTAISTPTGGTRTPTFTPSATRTPTGPSPTVSNTATSTPSATPTKTPTVTITPTETPRIPTEICLTLDGSFRTTACQFLVGGKFRAADLAPFGAKFYPPETLSIDLSANRDLKPDGVECSKATELIGTDPTDPYAKVIRCTDSTDAVIYGSFVLPRNFVGTGVFFEIVTFSSADSPAGTAAFQFACQCRGIGQVVNGDYGPVSIVQVGYSAIGQYVNERGVSDEVACSGGCAAGDTLFLAITLNDLLTTTVIPTDIGILSVKVRYRTTGLGE